MHTALLKYPFAVKTVKIYIDGGACIALHLPLFVVYSFDSSELEFPSYIHDADGHPSVLLDLSLELCIE